ncbi:hypothetical protein MYX07_06320 [Patescibacteria group bacterium AH-259-L07]|nr:hypothetical protein [Patescibacteria group bacterium AH-259-L07]
MYLPIYLAIFLPLVIIGIVRAISPLHDMGTADIIMLTVHNFGFVFGTGAATILNAFNIFSGKNEILKPVKPVLVRFLFKFVWLGLILMIVVHTLELLTLPNLVHWLKFLTVMVILAGVWYIYFSLLPRMKRLAPKPDESPSQEFIAVQKQLKIFPIIVLFFWFLDFFLNSIWLPALHL